MSAEASLVTARHFAYVAERTLLTASAVLKPIRPR